MPRRRLQRCHVCGWQAWAPWSGRHRHRTVHPERERRAPEPATEPELAAIADPAEPPVAPASTERAAPSSVNAGLPPAPDAAAPASQVSGYIVGPQDVPEFRTELGNGYLENPQVTVSVDQYRSQRIFLVGEVRQPGTYPLTGDMTLIEALARAGSTTPNAGAEAIIVRVPPGRRPFDPSLPAQPQASEVMNVDLRSLQQGATAQNLLLREGDTIVVLHRYF
jgi:SLBB domain